MEEEGGKRVTLQCTQCSVGRRRPKSAPAEFRTVNLSGTCILSNNDPGFSCANVGADTSCCTADNCPGGTSTCYSG